MEIDWNKYFDHIYVLSKPSSFDRRKILDKEFERIGLKNYQYCYGFENNLIDYSKYYNNDIKKEHIMTTIGHYSIIKTAYELGYENILIFEDDVRFLKDLNKIQEQLDIFQNEKDNIDFYYFDHIIVANILICFFDAIYLNRHAMEYMIYCIENHLAIIDSYINVDCINISDNIDIDYINWLWIHGNKVTDILIPKLGEKKLCYINVKTAETRLCIQNDKIDDYNKDIDKCNIEEYNLL